MLVDDHVLAQQCLMAVVLLGVGVLCLARLKTGVYATFGGIGGLAAGTSMAVRAAASIEVRGRHTQAIFDFVRERSTLDQGLQWAFVVGIVLVAFAVVSDRAA